MGGREKELYRFGSFRLDVTERLFVQNESRVTINGKSMEPKVFDTLVALIRNANHLMSKEDLTKAIWTDRFVEETNLTRNISVLKKFLGEWADCVETVRTQGYRFVCDVRRINDEEDNTESEELIDQANALDVVLAHNDEDKNELEQIAEYLGRAGIHARFNESPYQDDIGANVRASSACAILVGPQGIGDWERREIAVAADRSARDPGFRVFPVLLPGVPDPFDVSTLPPFLSTRKWVDFRNGIDDPNALGELVMAIKAESVDLKDNVEATSDVCPYRGLQTFDEPDAEFFFGRDADIQRLIERLKATRFLAVLGPSGSGKSSLLRAGLIPALREGRLPDSGIWNIRVLVPGAKPLTNLAAQVFSLPQHVTNQTTFDLIDQMIIDERALHHYTLLALTGFPASARMVWLIDQFEEVFTLCRDEVERMQFMANLLYAASVPGGRNIVIIGMRADFYAKTAIHPELSRFIAEEQFLVSPLDATNLRLVIEEPAWRVGLAFEDGLVERILTDLESQPGALPLLEHTLLELWKRRHRGILTFNAYQDAGGAEGAIATRAEAIYAEFKAEQKEITRRIMLRLTQPGEGTEDTRRRAPLTELITRADESNAVEEVVRIMTDARLLTTSMDEQTRERWLDVSHETLIRGWPRLRVWVDGDRQALLVHRRLIEAAKEWQRLDGDEEVLYGDVRLSEVEEWRKRHEADLNDLERTFLGASTALQVKKRRIAQHRARQTVGGLIVILVVIGAFAFIALSQARRAAQQRDVALNGLSLSLAANAISQLRIDPEVSLLLAIEANQIARTEQAGDALRQALASSHLQAVMREHTAQVVSAAFSPNGKSIVTASVDKTARVWEIESGKTIAELRGHERKVNTAEFSPDGKVIVTASEDKTVRTWNAVTGTIINVLTGHTDAVNNAAFNADGRLVITASSDGTARVWDVSTGRSLMTLTGHKKWLNSAVFSPDGHWIVTASGDKTARVWNAQTGQNIKTLEHPATVLNVAFSPDGRFVTTASGDNTARLWEVGTWRIALELRGHTDNVNSAEFSGDGRWIVTASKDMTARVWDASTGKPVLDLVGHKSGVNRAVFSPDGKSIATASGDTSVRIWEVDREQSLVQLRGHKDAIFAAAFSPDGKWIVTASKDGTARIWDPTTGQPKIVLEGHKDSVQSAVFSPDGTLVATGSKDNTARIWEASTGKSVTELRGHEAIIHSVAFSPDGRLVVTASGDNTARTWEVSTGRELVVLRGHTAWVNTAAFSPDGRLVVTSSRDNTAKVWDIASGQIVTDLNVDTGYINSAQFSPDGKFVLAACGDNIGRIWNLATRQIVARLFGHSSWINCAEFSHDGKFAVTASGDKTARVWEVRTGQMLLEMRGQVGSLMAATFSPDDKFIATASLDGSANIYSCEVCGSIEELLAFARHRVTRRLSSEERAQYLPENAP